MVKREVIDKIGYFDQETFSEGYGEENDYCIRAKNAGFKLKVADDCLREKVENEIENGEKVKRSNISILFILPTKGGDGGSHSVVQETMGLRTLNVNAKIANNLNHKIPFSEKYLNVDEFCVYYKNQDELIRLSQHFDIVVATVFKTVKMLKNIIECHPMLLPKRIGSVI
ncbi:MULTISPECIES: hypothetical protein [unclassified Paenibacillus]|uniref:glycosyltransferase family 2 protein n=1 Tax=unclassified Paenibacillus TaxID=185978 RepID=UPI0024070F75|nr:MULTISPECIES: hypothetical protein [unclassified Paenibacillus]MDF9843624.1 hypothetical protein [Paenibacillus sp. PastF-2]MDF9850212.1 hypothetical protein [Paenibacillus sp. PastM-2]MDF9856847.1 hypothetical protein [Paenibacillus sp. PastF-1]MDH6482059.1 hypothetical protein [Paenibacillus sp. PastH-2]MDH6509483.1 hypothetical protein [Paenibacillus sp. PastM-3]